jgi:AcrR family transcriptional regulator
VQPVAAPARLTQGERRARTRASLLDAATRVFARRGFDGASLEDVAAEAGLSKGALYYNFASKEELFLAILDQHLESRLAMLEDVRSGGDPAESLREGARRIAASLREDRDWCLLFLEFCTQAARDPAIRRPFNERMDRVSRAMRDALGADARFAGPLPDAIEAVINGVAMHAMLHPREDVEPRLAEAFELLWAGARSGATG